MMPKESGFPILVAAALQVGDEKGKGVEPDTIAGDGADEGVGIGDGVAVGDGAGPEEAEVLGQGVELDNGEFGGVLAFQGVDAAADLGQGVHGFASLGPLTPWIPDQVRNDGVSPNLALTGRGEKSSFSESFPIISERFVAVLASLGGGFLAGWPPPALLLGEDGKAGLFLYCEFMVAGGYPGWEGGSVS